MADTLITVEKASKKFCRNLKRSLWYGVKDLGSELLFRNNGHQDLRRDEFWAVKDFSLELKRGETLGLLGRNGAGKTTLLRMLNGLIKPDAGRLEVRGRTQALIALGTGFNPILTGRENIYVNAAVLGMPKSEVDRRFDEIVDFSGIPEFIDAPVQSYSSGMVVRLGFAVAIQMDPDILIIDEVLAVGDVGFRNKCYDAIDKIISNAAVILVTHNMEILTRISNRCIVLKEGHVVYEGQPVEASVRYSELFEQQTQNLVKSGHKFEYLKVSTKHNANIVNFGEDCGITIMVYSPVSYHSLLLKINLSTSSGQIAAEYSSCNYGHIVNLSPGRNKIEIHLKGLCLLPQKYYVSFSLIANSAHHIFWCRNVAVIYAHGSQQGHQPYQLLADQFNNEQNPVC